MGLVIRAVCGNGLGSSMLVAMNIKQILDKHGVKYDDVSNANLGTVEKGVSLIVAAADVVDQIDDFDKSKIISLTNLLSKQELEEKLRAVLKF